MSKNTSNSPSSHDNFQITIPIDELAERIAMKVQENLGNVRITQFSAQRLLTVKQAAPYIGRSIAAVRHLINTGKIPIHKADGRVFVDIRDLDDFIEKNKQRRSDERDLDSK
jgi:hypothetical protein